MTTSDFKNPVIAVVMAVFNGERWLRKSVDSVFSQSYHNFEFIIVDDGSTDKTAEILKTYSAMDKRIKVISNILNEGVVRSRNRAILSVSASVKYIAILDADDISVSDRLQKQVTFMDGHPGISLLGGQASIIDEDNHFVGTRSYPVSTEAICKVITRYNPFVHSAVMIRRSALNVVGLYNESFVRCQDYELWLRIAAKYPVANLADCLVHYRISPDQIKQKNLKETLFFTQKIQARWLLEKNFFSLVNLAMFFSRFLLFFLPGNFCLWLFKKISYRR